MLIPAIPPPSDNVFIPKDDTVNSEDGEMDEVNCELGSSNHSA